METYNLYQYDKMSIITKLVYRFSTMSIKTPADFTVEIDRLILKFYENVKILEKTKLIWKKKLRTCLKQNRTSWPKKLENLNTESENLRTEIKKLNERAQKKNVGNKEKNL